MWIGYSAASIYRLLQLALRMAFDCAMTRFRIDGNYLVVVGYGTLTVAFPGDRCGC